MKKLAAVVCGLSLACGTPASPGDGGAADAGALCPGPGGFSCSGPQDCCAGQFCRDEGPDSGVPRYCSACKGGGPAAFAGPCSQGGESCAANLDCSPQLHCAFDAGATTGVCH